MGDKVSLFDNERKMAWMRYFSEKTALDVEALKLIDVSVKNKNLIPAVEANRVVLAFCRRNAPHVVLRYVERGARRVRRVAQGRA